MSLIGIISDTHDHLVNVRRAIALFNEQKVNRVIHCGDIVARFVLEEFSRLQAPLTVVLGNCDGDPGALQESARRLGFEFHLQPALLELSQRRVFVSHQPLNSVPECDFYLHGHTHRQRYEPGKPVIVNPGEACGWLSGVASVAILDLTTGTVEFPEFATG
ncbi:MAG: metallophosphoesterase [candidate division WOR-3 bacterium]|uniref:Phosphoesterase n=1 Tax=candidate division WOR-3 bacterium TaxID=2052148 RepID=A0A7C1X1E3_UNCW3|nr:metallophosphoesterase [candidate division WOR-3 bacterium]